jgi:peptidyl-prolyl cis-trans isomerase A (cyclophilin A)
MIDGNIHPPIDVPGNGPLRARFTTSMGVIEAELFEDEAPNTVANFVGLALGTKEYIDPISRQKGGGPYYNGTVFHRVIPEFMIQAGDPTGTGTGNPGFRFNDEFNRKLRHDRPGILSMANSGANTNGGQFFITEVPTPHLNDRHSVFGRVIEGNDLVFKIARVPAGARNQPNEPVVLQSVEIYRA